MSALEDLLRREASPTSRPIRRLRASSAARSQTRSSLPDGRRTDAAARTAGRCTDGKRVDKGDKANNNIHYTRARAHVYAAECINPLSALSERRSGVSMSDVVLIPLPPFGVLELYLRGEYERALDLLAAARAMAGPA